MAAAASGMAGRRRIGLFVPSLGGGGAERCMLSLGQALAARGHQVDLLLCDREGRFVSEVPRGIDIVELRPVPMALARLAALAADPAGFSQLLRPVLSARKPPHRLPHLVMLARYMRANRPQALLAALPTPNLLAVWARRLAGVKTRVVVSQHNTLSQTIGTSPKWRKRFLPPLVHRGYLMADAIVAVSHGVADDLTACAGIPHDRVTTIYNPIVSDTLRAEKREPVHHAWLAQGGPPVILGAGALIAQKDHPTLLRAFARVRTQRAARLVILGEARGSERDSAARAELTRLAARLGVEADVCLAGFVRNPFSYMARASVFVLSSAWEGFGNVLVEALACGCPVVSTDCPSGPAEILEGGRHGRLVPVGDDKALADAILATLDHPPDTQALQARAEVFSVDKAVARYLELLLGRQ
jgi:glycosyltransferase involved in cell wall biosynthesis